MCEKERETERVLSVNAKEIGREIEGDIASGMLSAYSIRITSSSLRDSIEMFLKCFAEEKNLDKKCSDDNVLGRYGHHHFFKVQSSHTNKYD